LQGGDQKREARVVHLTKYHPADLRNVYHGREQAGIALALDMSKVVELLGRTLAAGYGSDEVFEFYETNADCILCSSGIPPCLIARVSDAKNSMTLWTRPDCWKNSHHLLTSPCAGRPRLLPNVQCQTCQARHPEGTEVCLRENCRRPITQVGIGNWLSAFPSTNRTARMERLKELGIEQKDAGLSKYGAGECDGRSRRKPALLFTRSWCRDKLRQAQKSAYSSWAEFYDNDTNARVNAQEHGFPRVLRHWNTDIKTGRLIQGAPELVILEEEVSYLRQTMSETDGLVEPNDNLPRPQS
jgi:hypothetical protein